MVIGDVVSQQAKQVAVVEDDDVVEEFAGDAADPPFRDAVLPWAPGSRAGRLGAEGLHFPATSRYLGGSERSNHLVVLPASSS
jgi:hypothetical protein